jgi:hypothetical protein
MDESGAAAHVFAVPALCTRILMSLKPEERRAFGVAACACRGLAAGARSALVTLQQRELPHAGRAGRASGFVEGFAAAAAACEAQTPPAQRAWRLKTLTFVLQLRRADWQLVFTAVAQPTPRLVAPQPGQGARQRRLVKDMEFRGAFCAGHRTRRRLLREDGHRVALRAAHECARRHAGGVRVQLRAAAPHRSLHLGPRRRR